MNKNLFKSEQSFLLLGARANSFESCSTSCKLWIVFVNAPSCFAKSGMDA